MKNKVLFSIFMVVALFMRAQEVQEQKPFKNTGITIYPFGMSFLKNNQFQKSLQKNGIDIDIPKMFFYTHLKVIPIDFGQFGLFSVDVGMEGNNKKTNAYFSRLFAIFGTIEYLFPIVEDKKIRLFPSVGMEYSFTKFEYYTLDDNPISSQNLFLVKDGSVNLSQSNHWSALIGLYLNYYFFEKQGVSLFAKYRIPLKKNNDNWKVANTDRIVTDLNKYIPNHFIFGVGYVFVF